MRTDQRRKALQNSTAVFGSNTGARHGSGEQVLAGSFGTLQGISGIELQCCKHVELHNRTVCATLAAGLVVIFLLEGEISFCLDGQLFHIDSRCAPAGFVFNLTRPTAFSRSLVKGNRVEKLVMTVERATALRVSRQQCFADLRRRVLEQQLFHQQWQATSGQIARCREVLAGSVADAPVASLNQEAQALSLLQLSLETLIPQAPVAVDRVDSVAGLGDNITARIDTILARAPSDQCPLPAIAAKLNMSTSKLQRVFKQQCGRTVMEYIRSRRLLNAQQAMIEQGISIGEAAFMAGYNHSSNFCLAFKKQFGYNPGEVTRVNTRGLCSSASV